MSKIEIIRPGELVSLNPAHSGLAYGFGVFETIRVASGCIQFWVAHWSRLERSAKALEILLPCEREEALNAVRDFLSELSGSEQTIKLSVIKEAGDSRLLVYSRPAFSAPESAGLLVDGSYRLNESSPLAGLKTHNYIENMHFMKIARSKECYDLVRFNCRGEVVEGAVSNLFWANNGKLFTPDRRTGLLAGVVRGAILSEMEVVEGFYSEGELLAADAVFVTNSSVGALPIEWILRGSERIYLRKSAADLQIEIARAIERAVEADSIPI